MKLSKKYLALGLLGSVLGASSAYAVTQTVTADFDFETAITLTNPTHINFGQVAPGALGDTYKITTAGVISKTGVTTQIIGGTHSAGIVHIVGGTGTIAISTSTYGNDLGVTLSAATCNYDGGGESGAGVCDTGLAAQTAPGAGKDLLLGVTATLDGTTVAGDHPAPTFVVTVIYG